MTVTFSAHEPLSSRLLAKSSGDLAQLLGLRLLRLLRLAPGDVHVVGDVVSDLARELVDSAQLRVDDRVLGCPAIFLELLPDARLADGAGLEDPVVAPHDLDPRRSAAAGHDLCGRLFADFADFLMERFRIPGVVLGMAQKLRCGQISDLREDLLLEIVVSARVLGGFQVFFRTVPPG